MKPVAIIINPMFHVEAIVASGESKEFVAGSGNKEIKVKLNLNQAEKLFKRYDVPIRFERGCIFATGNYHLYDLEIYVSSGDNTKLIDNRVKITKQLMIDNDVIGYEVAFLGANNATKRMKKEDIYESLDCFKPLNFFTRFKDNAVEIVSKPGCTPLNELPIERFRSIDRNNDKNDVKEKSTESSNKVETESKVNKKPENVSSGEKHIISEDTANKIDNKIVRESNADLVSLFNVLSELDAKIVHTDNEYYRTTIKKYSYGGDFIYDDDKVYLTSEPKLIISESNMRVNLYTTIKGTVNVKDVDVPVKVINKRCVIENIYNNMHEIGVVIPENKYDTFVSYIEKFDDAIKVHEFNGQEMEKLNRTLNMDGKRAAKIDIFNIRVLDDEALNNSIMSIDKLIDTQALYLIYNLFLKFFHAMKMSISKDNNIVPDVYYEYRNYDKNMLGTMKLKSIDTCTGIYNRRFEVYDDESNTEDNGVKIEYAIYGMNMLSKITKARLVSGDIEGLSSIACGVCYNEIIKARTAIANLASLEEKMKYIDERKKLFSDNVDELKTTLWMHKYAELCKGNGIHIHTDDADMWKFVSGGKNDNNYVYTDSNIETKLFNSCKFGVKVSKNISIPVKEQ